VLVEIAIFAKEEEEEEERSRNSHCHNWNCKAKTVVAVLEACLMVTVMVTSAWGHELRRN
jgi:hypothetical protein